jgi:hypothetical protein
MFIILNLFFITLFIFIFYKVYRKCEVQAGRVLLIILGIIIMITETTLIVNRLSS